MLEGDLVGDEEECALRDHLLAVHPKALQPETRGVLLRHFGAAENGCPSSGRKSRPGNRPVGRVAYSTVEEVTSVACGAHLGMKP